jgi:hypothetical protein
MSYDRFVYGSPNCEPRGDGLPFEAEGSDRAKLGALTVRIAHAVSVLFAALREIFDESAYTRFLSRHQLVVSRESYAAFLREQEFIKSRRHRCC